MRLLPRVRPFGELTGFEATKAALLDVLAPVPDAEDVPLQHADGRVLAEELRAPIDVPAFDRSAMDGYALRAADALPGARLPVLGRVPAGEPWVAPVPKGAALEIATGGLVPPDLDAVVPVEQTERAGREVVLTRAVDKGAFVSVRGGDLARGSLVLPAGAVLDPARVGLVGSLGLSRVRVRRRPRVAVFGSGTEVLAPGSPIRLGSVFDGNTFALEALARRHGAEVRRLPVVPDQEDAFARALKDAAGGADLVVTTGGSSVGERDLLRGAVEAAGQVKVHGVRLRPGKPVLVGRVHGVPLLGLPGYPASTVVTAEMLLVPAVRTLAGLPPAAPRLGRARLAADVAKPADVTLVHPVAVEAGVARSTYKESGTLTSLTGSTGYVLVPEGVERLAAGSEVEVVAWT